MTLVLHSYATLRYIEMEHGKAITINKQAKLNKHSQHGTRVPQSACKLQWTLATKYNTVKVVHKYTYNQDQIHTLLVPSISIRHATLCVDLWQSYFTVVITWHSQRLQWILPQRQTRHKGCVYKHAHTALIQWTFFTARVLISSINYIQHSHINSYNSLQTWTQPKDTKFGTLIVATIYLQLIQNR